MAKMKNDMDTPLRTAAAKKATAEEELRRRAGSGTGRAAPRAADLLGAVSARMGESSAAAAQTAKQPAGMGTAAPKNAWTAAKPLGAMSARMGESSAAMTQTAKQPAAADAGTAKNAWQTTKPLGAMSARMGESSAAMTQTAKQPASTDTGTAKNAWTAAKPLGAVSARMGEAAGTPVSRRQAWDILEREVAGRDDFSIPSDLSPQGGDLLGQLLAAPDHGFGPDPAPGEQLLLRGEANSALKLKPELQENAKRRLPPMELKPQMTEQQPLEGFAGYKRDHAKGLLGLLRLAPNFYRSGENYTFNKEHDITGRMIHGQGVDSVKDLRIGAGTAEQYGCGAIAVYNALNLLQREPSFAEVVRQCEQYGGAVGTDPYIIGDILDSCGASSRKFTDLASLQRAAEPGDVIVMSFWNYSDNRVAAQREALKSAWLDYRNDPSRETLDTVTETLLSIGGAIEHDAGSHHVCVQYSTENKAKPIVVYNPYNDADCAVPYNSLYAAVDDGIFLTGYILRQADEEEKTE